MTMVQLRHVSKRYGGGSTEVRALDLIDLEVPAGEFVAIMGPSGSGKSTLLSLLGGLDIPTSGTVSVGGERLDDLPESRLALLRRVRIGFVFQSFNLVPILTAAENVAMPLLLAGQKGQQVEQRVTEVLGLVGLADRGHHRPAELSGGQQQRVAIARALVAQPALLLADEPTGNLDTRTSLDIMQLLHRSWQELGQTIILITHDPHVAAWAERIIFLRDGRIVGEVRSEGERLERAASLRQQLDAVSSYAEA